MELQSDKLELIKMVLETNDKSIIDALKNIFKAQQKDVWKELSAEEQEEIDLRILEANRGDQVDL